MSRFPINVLGGGVNGNAMNESRGVERVGTQLIGASWWCGRELTLWASTRLPGRKENQTRAEAENLEKKIVSEGILSTTETKEEHPRSELPRR